MKPDEGCLPCLHTLHSWFSNNLPGSKDLRQIFCTLAVSTLLVLMPVFNTMASRTMTIIYRNLQFFMRPLLAILLTGWSFALYADPNAPVLTSPPDSSTTADNTPTFQWQAVSGAVKYAIELYRDAGLTDFVLFDEIDGSTEFTPGSALSDDTYYWHVQANDGISWGPNNSPPFSVTVNTSGAPDLVVDTPVVNPASLEPFQNFLISTTVRNIGSDPSPSTTLLYRRSTNSNITSGDPLIGTDPVSSIAAGGTSPENNTSSAPLVNGTYWIGACVDPVLGESNTSNNCSGGVQITVADTPGLDNDFGMNGLFIDTTSDGNGFDFNVHDFGLTIFYYGHTASGDRLWLISQLFTEDLEFNVPYVLNMFERVNGVFGQSSTGETLWGTFGFTLTDCDSGNGDLNGVDGNAAFDFVRFAGQHGIGCQ